MTSVPVIAIRTSHLLSSMCPRLLQYPPTCTPPKPFSSEFLFVTERAKGVVDPSCMCGNCFLRISPQLEHIHLESVQKTPENCVDVNNSSNLNQSLEMLKCRNAGVRNLDPPRIKQSHYPLPQDPLAVSAIADVQETLSAIMRIDRVSMPTRSTTAGACYSFPQTCTSTCDSIGRR